MRNKESVKQKIALFFLFLPALIWFFIVCLSSPTLAVDDSVCARVKLEIRQELTLERQAFDAHMRITNEFSHITLKDVDVNVSFTDEQGNSVLASSDPDNPDALFFIRLDSLENIENVDGTGAIQPTSTADIHWLIIPAPGAANGVPQGTLYYVGATLIYTIGGEEHITDVSPDYIFVKPMPELTLDYFLPTDVYSDDAFTPEIEPPIPFFLGVRVKNNGSGVARDMKINSAQPKIIENEQGLLIGFVIEGCEVNGQAATPSLLADLGDIEPNGSAVARWVMTCSLSGQFVEFTADYSHSDELGGELTSLLEAVSTHFLVQDVLVDVAGRDSVRDFLAKDGDVCRVYESENIDTEVTNQSGASTLAGSGYEYILSTPVTAGFMYVKLPDPHAGQKEIKEVVRSDGKRIKPENAWLSKTRNEDKEWEYFLNIFDTNTTGSYTVSFADAAAIPHAPVLQLIPDRTVAEAEQLSFLVEATDADGTVPSLGANTLPAQASFIDTRDGTGIFDWTPTKGQAGVYEITFSASDGVLEDSQRVVLTVNSTDDTDGDGMPDAWEMAHFGTLDRDGTGDFDGDGITNLDEFLNGTDPTESNQPPTIPVIHAPEAGAEITALQPDLMIENSTDPDGDAVTYVFELYSDQEITTLIASESDVSEGIETTLWVVPVELSDNTWYFWRVRATDGFIFSVWAYGSFFVNTANDPPGDFQISSPHDNSEVDILTPALEVNNSIDIDEDNLTYTFELYSDSSMSNLIASASNVQEGENGSTSWTVDSPLNDSIWYYWRAIVTDEHGATAETSLTSFLVNSGNAAPEAPVISSPAIGSEVATQDLDLVVINATDTDSDSLTYFFELDKTNTFDSTFRQTSGEISEGLDTTTWHVTSLEDNTCYYWRFKATGGNAESTWAQGSFFVNTTNDSPSTPTRRNPGWSSWVDTLTPTLKLNPARDPDNDTLTYLFEVYADSDPTSLVTQGESDTTRWTLPSALNDTTWYYWRAKATDEHDAASAWSSGASFFVKDNGVDDTPEIAILEPAKDLLTNGQYILITWEDSDPDTNADITLSYDTDSAGQGGTLIAEGLKEDPDGASDTFIWDITGISDGTYYVYAAITDGNNTTATCSPGSLTIDRAPPTILTVPLGGTYLSARSVVLSTDEPADIYYTLDNSDPTTSSPAYTEPIDISEETTLKALAVDVAGNQSIIITETYRFNVPPTISGTPPPSVNEDTPYEFTPVANDENVGDILTFSIVNKPLWADFDTTTGALKGTPENDGVGTTTGIVITVTDAGGESASLSAFGLTVVNVNDPPVAFDDSYTMDEDTTIMVDVPGVLGNDSDIDSVTLTADLFEDVSEGLLGLNEDGSFTYKPGENFDEVDSFTYKANDGSLQSDIVATVTITVTPINDTPVADADGPYISDESTSITFDASNSSDVDSEELQYRWDFDNDGEWDTESSSDPTATYTWYDDYTGAVVVEVSDGELTRTDTASVTVIDVAPSANAGDDQTVNEADVVSFQGSFTDPGVDTYTIHWNFGDGSEAIDTLTPTHVYADNGTYTVTLTITDDDNGVGTDTLTVTVNNVPPTVEAGSDQTANEGDTVNFSGSFTDPGTDTHTIEWDFGDGAKVSGSLTPTHVYGDNGVYTITLAITDDDGGVGTDTLTITVNNVAPTITNLMSNSPSNGELGFFSEVNDPAGLNDPITYHWDFGDGKTSSGLGLDAPSHTYAGEGEYAVTLLVDDGDGGKDTGETQVVIDKTPPHITISEPKAKYYYNTQDITIDFEVEDPISNGVSSGLVEQSATLDGQVVQDGQIIDLSELRDGTHTFKVVASDLAGNEVEEVVIFEVGPAPAMVHIEPHRWNLSWLDPFDDDKKSITAYISLENVEVETILSTFIVPMLETGEGYGDFVVVEVVAAEDSTWHGCRRIRSVALKHVGTGEVDILASSGNRTWDFYGVKEGDTIRIDAGEGKHLEMYTVLSYYTCEPPLYSAADIIAETVLLNGKVPIIDGSAELITEEPSQLDQPRVIAEQPFIIVEEGRHHVSLTGLGDPERITLKVGNQTIFEDEPYPIRWHDRFSLDEDDEAQMMKVDAAKKTGTLNVYQHNLQEEARIYLDGALALTIPPDVKFLVLRVQFNRFEAIASLPKEVLERGGDWEVTTYEGVRLLGKHSRKHITIADLGNPEKVKLVVGDSVIFDDEPFPIRWEDKCFIVDGERQDMSIYTSGRSGHNKYLSIHCKSLTRDAKLYLDGKLALVISPPPDVEVSVTGDLELDGDPATFDGSFSGLDEIELKGKIPHNYDIDNTYQRIDTSGSPALEAGDMFGDFEVVDFTEGYEKYRITTLEFRYDGRRKEEAKVYKDHRRRHLIGSYDVYPGDTFSVDVSEVEGDKVYLHVGHKHKDIRLAGKNVAEVGDKYHDCTVVDITKIPEGPPHYVDLTLAYIGATGPISITAYDGKWGAVIGTYEMDPVLDPSFTIDGSGLKRGHIGGNLVLEYQ